MKKLGDSLICDRVVSRIWQLLAFALSMFDMAWLCCDGCFVTSAKAKVLVNLQTLCKNLQQLSGVARAPSGHRVNHVL